MNCSPRRPARAGDAACAPRAQTLSIERIDSGRFDGGNVPAFRSNQKKIKILRPPGRRRGAPTAGVAGEPASAPAPRLSPPVRLPRPRRTMTRYGHEKESFGFSQERAVPACRLSRPRPAPCHLPPKPGVRRLSSRGSARGAGERTRRRTGADRCHSFQPRVPGEPGRRACSIVTRAQGHGRRERKPLCCALDPFGREFVWRPCERP